MKSVLHNLRGALVIALLFALLWLTSPVLACVFAALVAWAELGAAWSSYQYRKGHYSTYRGKTWRFGSVSADGFGVRIGKLCIGVRVELFRAHFMPLLFRVVSFARPRDGWALALWRVYYGPLDVTWHRYYPAQERRHPFPY